MTASLATSPTYPVPNKDARMVFTSDIGANFIKIYCTSAPLGSALRAKLEKDGASRVLTDSGDISLTFTFAPDRGGIYVLEVEEYTKGAAQYGGGYENDPNAAPSETLLATTSIQVIVGTKLTCKVGAGPDLATLALFVFGSTVQTTSVGIHGEDTPKITGGETSRARAAAEASGVLTAVAALAGVSVSTLLGTPSAVLDDLIVKLNAHRTQATVHNANDSDNLIDDSFRQPTAPDGVAISATEFLLKLSRHMRNDKSGAGTGTASYHQPSTNRADWAHLPLVSSAQPQASLTQMVAIADGWRAYEAHRTSAVHSTPDSTNVANSLPPLLTVHKAFLTELKASSPTVPTNTNPGVPPLTASGGMTEA